MTAMKKINRILYAGIFVSKEDESKLWNIIPSDLKDQYRDIPHKHITIFFHTDMPIDMMQYVLNHLEEEYTITIDGYVATKDLAVLRVFKCRAIDGTVAPCNNKTPHITLGVAEGVKPVQANEITDWNSIEPVIVKGYCRIIYKPLAKKPRSTTEETSK